MQKYKYKLLLCSKCNNKLDEPKLLPCGLCICTKYENQILHSKKREFDCECKDAHQMPKKRFPINAFASNFMSLKKANIRNESFKTLEKKFEMLKEKLNKSNLKIRQYCNLSRDEIDLKCESEISRINERREKIMKQMNEYELECTEKEKKVIERLEQFTDEINNLRSKIDSVNLQEEENEKLKDDIKKLDLIIECETKNVDNQSVFLRKLKIYDPNSVDTLEYESNHYSIEAFKSIGTFSVNYNRPYYKTMESKFVFINKKYGIIKFSKVFKNRRMWAGTFRL